MSLSKKAPVILNWGKTVRFPSQTFTKELSSLSQKNLKNIVCMLFILSYFSHVKVYIFFLIKNSKVTASCFVRSLTVKSARFPTVQDGYFSK